MTAGSRRWRAGRRGANHRRTRHTAGCDATALRRARGRGVRRRSSSTTSIQGWTRDDRPGGARCKVRLGEDGAARRLPEAPCETDAGRRQRTTLEPRIDHCRHGLCHETARLVSPAMRNRQLVIVGMLEERASGSPPAPEPSRLQSPLAVTRRMDQPKAVTFRAPGRSSPAVRQASKLHVVDTR
jgi:hypothetical protein